jgi:hypothetical protein
MEIALPLVALSGLYLINNQSKKKSNGGNGGNGQEGFLPNTNIPDVNYPEPKYNKDEYNELNTTSELMHNNRVDLPGAYTDKYFNVTSGSGNGDARYTSLTGESVDESYYQHNNMVPFFGSTMRNIKTDYNANESTIDAMTGAGSQIFSKKEQSPLFAPHDNLEWANGAPNATDFLQSRINPSMRMANVKPFHEQRVAPGLGLGYTTEGAGGYNSGMAFREQWVDKNVDELRVATNPKPGGNSLYGHEGPAMSYMPTISTADHIGRVEKNRVDTAFEWGHDRLFTTTGAEKKPSLTPIPVERNVHRPGTSMEYTGIATGMTKPYVEGEYMPSTNIQLGEYPLGVASATNKQFSTESDYGMKASKAYPNNRSENQNDGYFGIIGGAIGATVAPLLDVLRPSRKENTVGTLRPYQNAKSTVGQSYLFNPADKLPTTIRETTENSKYHWNINANQNGGAYSVTQHQTTNTNRQNSVSYVGNSSAGERVRAPRTYNAEYNQRNNDIKSSTIQGYMVQGNMNLFNGDMNMRGKEKAEYLKNSRALAPSNIYHIPDVGHFGEVQKMNSKLYSNIQLDRNNSDILDALKGNPYALSITR